MSVEKKDFPPVDAAGASGPSVDDSGPLELSDPEAAERRPRRKRAGLRVPSDNVPRPDRTGPLAIGGPGSAAVSTPGSTSTPPPEAATSGPPAGAPTSAPAGPADDLEVDVEFVDDDPAAPTTVPQNGSGPVAAATTSPPPAAATTSPPPAAATTSPPPAATSSPARSLAPVAATSPAPAPAAVSPSPVGFTPITIQPKAAVSSPAVASPAPAAESADPEELADEDLMEDRGEPTQVTKPPEAAAPAAPAATSPSAPVVVAPAPAAATPASPAAATSSPPAAPAPAAAAPPPPAATSPSPHARAATVVDEEEEISPSEILEVDSGPVAADAARTAAPATPAAPAEAAPPRREASATASVPPPAPPTSGSNPPPAPAPSSPPTPSAAAAAAAARPTPPKPPASRASQAAAAAVAQQAAAGSQPRPKKRKAKAWWEEIFDDDYLRTLPFLTPQATQREATFIAESLGIKPGMQVLDVGCGYGRHAMELAARGFHVVGLDLSLPLLIRGADEAQRRGLTINFVHGDMRELTFDAQFDGAYCVFSTFGYFDDETNKRVAQNICRALKPGARLVLEVLNRDYIIGDLPTRVWWEGDGCVVLEEVDFNYFTSRLVSNRSVVFEDGRQLEQEISMRAYSLHELGKVLHQVGFRVIEVSGNLATRGRFFGSESRQLIIVAEKRSEASPSKENAPATTPPADPTGGTARGS